MKIEIEASGSGEYGDFAMVRLYFSERAYIEVDAADAHNLGPGPSAGATVRVKGVGGDVPVDVWDGTVVTRAD